MYNLLSVIDLKVKAGGTITIDIGSIAAIEGITGDTSEVYLGGNRKPHVISEDRIVILDKIQKTLERNRAAHAEISTNQEANQLTTIVQAFKEAIPQPQKLKHSMFNFKHADTDEDIYLPAINITHFTRQGNRTHVHVNGYGKVPTMEDIGEISERWVSIVNA